MLKVKVSVGSVEFSVKHECGYCGRMKPVKEFGINPRTSQPYKTCAFCRAKKASRDFIGKTILDANGRRWLVKGYADNIDHRATYPYTCHSLDGDFTVWHTGEEAIRRGIRRAKVRQRGE